ncbi:hypothetical protein [Halorussus marinus]|nr:hypothetical protein [Halorussus marinus]
MPAESDSGRDDRRVERLFGSLPHIRVSRLPDEDSESSVADPDASGPR